MPQNTLLPPITLTYRDYVHSTKTPNSSGRIFPAAITPRNCFIEKYNKYFNANRSSGGSQVNLRTSCSYASWQLRTGEIFGGIHRGILLQFMPTGPDKVYREVEPCRFSYCRVKSIRSVTKRIFLTDLYRKSCKYSSCLFLSQSVCIKK